MDFLYFYLLNLTFLLWYLQEKLVGGYIYSAEQSYSVPPTAREVQTPEPFLKGLGEPSWSHHNLATAVPPCLGRQSVPRKQLESFFLLTSGDHIICCPKRYAFLKRFYLFILREGKGRRKGGWGTSMCGCLLSAPSWGPGLQPRRVPWLGLKPLQTGTLLWATTTLG